MMETFHGRRITIMGLGTRGGGVGVARFLAERGALVTVTDARPAEALTESIAALDGLPIRFVLGGHQPRDFSPEGADLVVRNPGVPRRAAMLQLARQHGLPIEMEMSLFLRLCPAPVIGITGTKGKTTTATLCAEILRAWDPTTVLAGNMGVTALGQLDRISPATPVVVELSSWQLEALIEHGLAPAVAVLTNISEDHLDHYDGYADYAATKRGIARHQRPGDRLVLNRDDPDAWQAASETAARVVPFGATDRGGDGAWLSGDHLIWRFAGEELTLPRPATPALAGTHGALNSLAALAAARLRGAPAAAIAAGLASFGGVPHRQEIVAEIDGVTYINDTAATAPAAAIAALRSLAGEQGRRVHLIAGGHDKKTDLRELAAEAATRAVTIHLLAGSATPGFAALLADAGAAPAGPFGAMAEAVASARGAARTGDVVLLSPGCASFGLFRDEFDRGERFRAAVRALTGASTQERGEPAPESGPPLVPTIARLPDLPAAVHFVGIGGIGMSGLARILHTWGYRVSGSDAAASDQTEALAALGIPVTIGHGDVARAAAADLVVMTAAVRGENPEVAAARAARVPIVKRAELLGLLANARDGVAVAGSAGKSTTSGMLVVALQALGADPSYAIGATIGAAGPNAAPGTGPLMVVEADEYDYSFLWLKPAVAIITNVEYDHPDLFPDQSAYDAAFVRFARGIRPGGTLVLAADDPGGRRLHARLAGGALRIVTFGETNEADWRLAGDEGTWTVRTPAGESLDLALAVPGRHNARNATAALAALVALGQEPAAAARALATFGGVGRRFELKGEAAGITVIDDYAHHPSKLRAAIAAARVRYPGRRLWAVFQPHTYSRTRALLNDFADVLRAADRVLLLEIYPARETDNLGISAADLRALLPPDTLAATGPADAVDRLLPHLAPGDVILTLGAGDVTHTGPALLERVGGGGEGRKVATDASNPAPSRRRAASGETLPGRPTVRLFRDEPMSRHTTWRIGGPADLLVRAATTEDLLAAIAWGREQGVPVTVIGGGSNLLVGDRGIRGLVILARTPGERADGLLAVEDRGDHVILRAGAQAPLSWVGRYAAEHGWAGLDWGVGLPGTIGGATVNNAGAHGTELKDYLERVVVCDNWGELHEHPAAWLEASYRMTRLKAAARPRPLVVIASIFRLPKGATVDLVRLADEHADFRKLTQPTGACAGSTFANPEGDYAGRLLEVAGLKGYRIGGVQFSPKHANWIVNTGGATAADVRALIAHAQAVVRERFGIELRPEVEEIGEP